MGTEEFWIPAAISALGTGVSYANQRNAQNRQNDSTLQGIRDQQAIQARGTAQARALTSQIAKDDPTQIASKATGDYVANLRRNAAGSTQGGSTAGPQTFGAPTSALAPTVGGSARYTNAKAGAQKETQTYGNTIADEMGSLDAAIRQRQNEGLSMNTLGTNLNTLGAESYTTNFVDQLRSQVAGQQNPWASLLSGLLTRGAGAYAMNADGGKKPPTRPTNPTAGIGG